MKDQPFKYVSYLKSGSDFYRRAWELQELFLKLKEHLEGGGLPQVEVKLCTSLQQLRGTSFDQIIIDETFEQAE